ncbi:MAG: HAMP domain-containing histidine kinase [Chloroflexi bacterium]|nr:MAG: HAMP domain-containing histidine kinase [Chloroflexota bacterium]
MAGALTALQWLVTCGFVVVGILSVIDWVRHRGQRRAYLASAIGLLGLVSLTSRLNVAIGYRFASLTTPVVLILFMASGYALLMFRGTFIPLRPRTRAVVAVLAGATTAFFLLVAPPPGTVQMSGAQSIALLALIVVWSGMVGEPVVRFWLASRGRPAVQRGRLRVLAAGFAAIIFILVVAGAGGNRLGAMRSVQIGFQVLALLSIPLIYASLAPPSWLKRFWREPDEAAFRRAVRELLLFSSDRETLARRALEWGLRTVGAEGGAIVDESKVLAIRGIEPELASTLVSAVSSTMHARVVRLDREWQNAVVVPLPLDSGRGAVVALSNAFMPLFGSDEVARLEEFGTLITAGLDRVRITERMAELERTKSQFLNLASHELRTPLSVIRGYLAMLDAGSLDAASPAGHGAISILSAKALEMNMLIEQMLDAARLEEGRLVLKPELLDPVAAVRSAVEVVRPLLGVRHQLVIDSSADPVGISADRERLGTILVNLIDNAVKYSPDGGEVRCSVRAQDGRVLIAVQDVGVGIASADLSHLFIKFSRLSNDQTGHVTGTGLGLYLCRELARQQGGDIMVDSTPGRGSTFTLTLPLAAATEERSTPRIPLTVLEATG